MAYDTALTIISNAARELGLGSVSAAYASTDSNILQLTGLLDSVGKDLVLGRDWTHLQSEASFVTWPNWAASTAYVFSAMSWAATTAYAVGDYRKSAGPIIGLSDTTASGLYRCVTAGTSAAAGHVGPNTTSSTITDGTCVWKFLSPVASGSNANSFVTHGQYYYECTTGGTSASSGGPIGTIIGGTESDASVVWTCRGKASQFALPADFAGMIDQSQWNRTGQLPVGGPIEAQVWQYLKGRSQGVVFNVLFRPLKGLLQLYPDTDVTGSQQIVYEYVSSYWVSATGGTTPTAASPTADTDIIYFPGLLVMRGLKLAWLKAHGFDSEHAQRQYDDTYDQAAGDDGASPVLRLSGGAGWNPLLGPANIPITGYGQ